MPTAAGDRLGHPAARLRGHIGDRTGMVVPGEPSAVDRRRRSATRPRISSER